MTDPASRTAAGRGTTLMMAAAAGLAVANIYYNQPMLGVIEAEFPGSSATGFIPTATQIGYALGLLFLVPLGDLTERRRLITVQFLILAGTLLTAGLAPGAWALVAASVAVGAASTVAQQVVPLAAALAPPERRGAAVGTVMAGLLCGILLSRVAAGFVAAHAGWREMFLLGAPLAAVCAVAARLFLPRAPAASNLTYGTALASLGRLWRDEPALRTSTGAQAMLFASFSVFWTVLAWHLGEPRFGLGADAAGLFGVIGAAGALAAPIAGRLSDARGSAPVIRGGILLALVAWALFGVWNALPALVVGVILLDLGVQGAMIANQNIIFALRPEARNRVNTLYMTGMFVGGALGSAGAGVAWNLGGWAAVVALGGTLAVVALFFRVVPAVERR